MTAIKDYYTIKLHDTDAAGILFYANQLRIVHDLYEKLLVQIGFGFPARFASRDFFIPIVHTEADFLHPLHVGDVVEVAGTVADVGSSSFTLDFRLTDLDGALVGTARTVHVTIDPATGKKISLPPAFRSQLETLAGDKS
jgi:1,4-dihydroxy-2-naphthoyl-CoA hydrolase